VQGPELCNAQRIACSDCQAKTFLENTGVHHDHQDLNVGDSRALVHTVQVVQQIPDLLLIEERN
jgi:hypothetical protein